MKGLDLTAALTAAALSSAFLAAAFAKGFDRASTTKAFGALGVPQPERAAIAVPLLETVVAVLLVLAPTAGATLALAALLGFTTFLIARLRQGIRVPCPCFGSAGQRPISAATVTRNVFLAAMALGVIAAAPGPRPRLLAVSVGTAFLVALAGRRSLPPRPRW